MRSSGRAATILAPWRSRVASTKACYVAAAVLLILALSTSPAVGWGGGPGTLLLGVSSIRHEAATATQRAIEDAQARLRRQPDNVTVKKALAAALLQLARETADPSHYTAADNVLATLGGARSVDPEVLLLEGTLLLARHLFTEALAVGNLALRALPSNPSVQGILADAYNELGRYDEALAATQRMADIRPDRAALARVSYSRELRGNVPGAIEAMQQAVIAGQPSGENAAYVQTLLGNLLLSHGRVDDATLSYAAALRAFPGFAPARTGQAALLVARGRPAEAAAIMDQVVTVQPVLQYVIAEGAYYTAAGMTKQAADAYQLVDAIVALYRANGVDVDLDIAVYQADRNPTAALLATTRRAAARRPGVAGHDALAWVLHRLGKNREAQTEIQKAIAIGDRDPLYRYHAAVIAAANADYRTATTQLELVLNSNPRATGIPPGDLATLASKLKLTIPPPPR